MKNILLYISVGFIMYFGMGDSLLKSQKICHLHSGYIKLKNMKTYFVVTQMQTKQGLLMTHPLLS